MNLVAHASNLLACANNLVAHASNFAACDSNLVACADDSMARASDCKGTCESYKDIFQKILQFVLTDSFLVGNLWLIKSSMTQNIS